jgi:P-type conjugative transfer protein TrbJ
MRLVALTLLATTALASPAISGEVNPGESIQAEIDRVKAAGGGTVSVRRGTYHESITLQGSNVKLISADGSGAAKIVSSGTAIYFFGGSGNEIRGFEIEAGSNGNGIQAGGNVSDYASNYIIADNRITTAGEDGIKLHQLKGSRIEGNLVDNAGMKPGNSNRDTPYDMVAVEDTKFIGNAANNSQGDTCLMMKGGTRRVTVSGNVLKGCKETIHVGGIGDDKFSAPGWDNRQAYDNVITGNELCGETPFRLFAGEEKRRDNTISNNACSGKSVGPTMTGFSSEIQTAEGRKFEEAIKRSGAQGHTASAIAEGFALNGWGISESTVEAIIAETMTGQQALDAGLITPVASGVSGTGGQTQNNNSGSRRDSGDSYFGGKISLSSIPGATCAAGNAAAGAAGAAGAVWSFFTGGEATSLLQVAQQIQLYTANACAFANLQLQLRMLWIQIQNLKNIDLTTFYGTIAALHQVRALVGSVDGTTYHVNRVAEVMGSHFPDTYVGRTDEDVMNQHIIWEQTSRDSVAESWRIQSQIMQHRQLIEQNVTEQVNALDTAPGIVGAQQATGHLITTLIQQAANMETASIAHYRAMEQNIMKEQAEDQNEREMYERRSRDWGNQGTTEIFEGFR